MKYSHWGTSIRDKSGITTLMRDLSCVHTDNESLSMLGGGAPLRIPAIEDYFRKQMEAIMEQPQVFEDLFGNYGEPQGLTRFVESLAALLSNEFNWNIEPENIAITNGSQMAFTLLFRMLAGKFSDGSRKKILLPITPEYIGYSDTGEEYPLFHSRLPQIVDISANTFKYRVDFDNLAISSDINAICVSRPTNPTGNVLGDNEIHQLSNIAKQNDIPLIIDSAYGLPFPGLVYTDANAIWNENIVLVLSFSKLGLPGTRTGIVVANTEIIDMLACTNAVATLASSNFGVTLACNSVATGEILSISREIILPRYKKAASFATETVHSKLSDVPYKLHSVDGAFFLWLWFPDLPITCYELYERLKARNVIIVPGNFFFPGLQEEWSHRNECIRISYAQPEEDFSKGVEIIADELKRAYASKTSEPALAEC